MNRKMWKREKQATWAWQVFTSRLEAGLNNGDLPMPARTEETS